MSIELLRELKELESGNLLVINNIQRLLTDICEAREAILLREYNDKFIFAIKNLIFELTFKDEIGLKTFIGEIKPDTSIDKVIDFVEHIHKYTSNSMLNYKHIIDRVKHVFNELYSEIDSEWEINYRINGITWKVFYSYYEINCSLKINNLNNGNIHMSLVVEDDEDNKNELDMIIETGNDLNLFLLKMENALINL